MIVGVVTAVTVGGSDDGDVSIPSTTLPPSTTTTVPPWAPAQLDDLPPVHSRLVPVGAQLVAYHSVDADGSVDVVVVDLAEARVNWRRRVEVPDRNPGVELPPPAYQPSQNLIHVFVDESRRAPADPLPGDEPADPTPTPTVDPDAEPELAVVGIDASDGFGITDLPFDFVPAELPSMCGESVCFAAVDLDGSPVLALVNPTAGSIRVGTEGFRNVLVEEEGDALTIGDLDGDGVRAEVVATSGYRTDVAWTATVEELFGSGDVTFERGWDRAVAVDGSWALWFPSQVPGDFAEDPSVDPLEPGDVIPAGIVGVVGRDGSRGSRWRAHCARGSIRTSYPCRR